MRDWADLWKDFPEQLAEATGCGVFVYSRAGYGRSDPVSLPRPITYMHYEGLDVLPELLGVIGEDRVVWSQRRRLHQPDQRRWPAG